MAVVDSVCPEQRSVFESVSLSSRTVLRRIEEMSDNVHDSLKTRISTLVAFSLALDESTDVKDTAQLAVFIRGVTADLNVCEEFLQLVRLRGTTTGKDIFDAMLQCGATLPRFLPPCLRDDRRCPSDDWPEEGRRVAAGAPL